MALFDIYCAQLDDEVEIHFGGPAEARGDPAFRGFSCPHEAACQRAGIMCRLYAAEGYRPFEPADAFRHLQA